MLKSQKLGGSNVPIPKVGGVRTPPTRAVAAPMSVVVYLTTHQRHLGYLVSSNGHLVERYNTPKFHKS